MNAAELARPRRREMEWSGIGASWEVPSLAPGFRLHANTGGTPPQI